MEGAIFFNNTVLQQKNYIEFYNQVWHSSNVNSMLMCTLLSNSYTHKCMILPSVLCWTPWSWTRLAKTCWRYIEGSWRVPTTVYIFAFNFTTTWPIQSRKN